MDDIPRRLNELDRANTIVVMCHSGVRSLAVARYLQAQGFARVFNLPGGIGRLVAGSRPHGATILICGLRPFDGTFPPALHSQRPRNPMSFDFRPLTALVACGLLATPLAAKETLLDVYQRALQSDPLIREAEATYLAALEARPQARSALLPQIDISGSETTRESSGQQRHYSDRGHAAQHHYSVGGSLFRTGLR